MILLGIFLAGCESTKVVTKVETKVIRIPDAYFQVEPIDLNRTIDTSKDASLFMIDLYNSYKECIINLESIKEINGSNNSINK